MLLQLQSLTVSMTSSNDPIFPSFPRLPLELRLRIWELLLPPRRDLKIGPSTCEDKASELGEVWTNKPPLTLLSTCRESRKAALDNGCFASNPRGKTAFESLTWIDRHPRAVYLPLTAASYSRARSLPIEIEAFACIWPTVEGLQCLKQSLLNEPPSTPVQVIYVGLSAIAYDHPVGGVTCPDLSNLQPELLPPNPLYEGSDILVMDLDDSRLPTLLECADGMGKGKQPSFKFHNSASCFLETLRLYWESNSRALELREAWYGTTQGHNSDGAASPGSQLGRIELRPAVIFGKTRDALFFGRSNDRRPHERLSGLVFSISSLNLPKRRPVTLLGLVRGPNYDCGVMCGARMAS